MKTIKLENFDSRFWAIALAGSLCLASAQSAQAAGEDRVTFREFRQLNPDLERHSARQMFRQMRHNPGVGGIGLPDPLPYPNLPEAIPFNPGVPFCPEIQPKARAWNGPREVKNQSLQYNDGRLIRLSGGVNLDLTSQERNITLGNNLFKDGGSIVIQSGSESRTLTAGSQVSAAEFIAAKQVLAGGGQKVIIDAAGRATGGQVDLDAITQDNDVMRATNLVVAKEVTTYGDFSKRSDFRLLGDLTNFGTVHATSSSSVKGGTIRADDINNYRGATISSTVDLTLAASGTLNNDGTISSDGALTLTAGGAVNNSGRVSAHTDLTLTAPNLNNRGLLSAASNVTLDGPSSAVLTVNNDGGTVAALNGSINVRNADYTGTADSFLWGGDLYSRDLNLYAGQGTTNVSVDDLTGTVNGAGMATHVLAQTRTLNIGSVCLTGDPTFYNTQGDINIGANVDVTEDLVFVAAGNITSANSITISAGDATEGKDITFIAGADFEPIGSVLNSPDVPPLSKFGGVEVSGKKSNVKLSNGDKISGGSILLGNNVNIIARVQTPTSNHDGGNILMNAFEGKKGDGTGRIIVDGTSMSTGGVNLGSDGGIFLLASASTGEAIRTGKMDTSGGANAEFGDIGIFTVKLTTSQKGPVIYNDKGVRTSASILTGKGLTKADILVTQLGAGVELNATNDLDINAGGEIYVQGDIVVADDADLFAVGELRDGASNAPIIAGDTVSLVSQKANVGISTDLVNVNAPSLEVFAKTSAFVAVAGTGGLLISNANAKNILEINAGSRDITSANPMSADVITLVANTFVGVSDVNAKSQLTIRVNNGDLINDPFNGALLGDKLILVAANGNIGENAGDRYFISGFNDINATASGSVFIGVEGSGATFSGVDASNIDIESEGSLAFAGNTTAKGALMSLVVDSGTLTVGGNVDSVEGITLESTSAKGKLVFAKDATVNTFGGSSGDISISVGPTSGTPFVPSNPNLTISGAGGTATFTGSGFKALAPVNKLILTGADIKINNGAKSANNLVFNGNVVIEADPPIPVGTPTYFISFEKEPKPSGNAHGAVNLLNAGSNELISSDVVGSNSSGTQNMEMIQLNGTNELLSNSLTTSGFRKGLANAETSFNDDDSYMLVGQPSRFEHGATLWTDLELGSSTDANVKASGMPKKLTNGSGLVIASKSMTVETARGNIQLPAGAVALISVGQSHLSVYNLHDGATSGINVIVDGQRIPLLPGRHACIAQANANSFAEVNPLEAIAHRSVRKHNTISGNAVFSSEFSVVSAATVVKPLKAIMASENKEAKKIANQLLKTSAVLMHLGGNTAYELQVKPRMVALR